MTVCCLLLQWTDLNALKLLWRESSMPKFSTYKFDFTLVFAMFDVFNRNWKHMTFNLYLFL